MANKIETSTSALDHFVCCGTYETYLGEYMGGVSPADHADADAAVGKLAVDIIAEALWDILPSDVNGEFECEYVRTYHPAYYNFETDYAIFTFEYSDELKNWMFDYVVENQAEFKDFLKKNYTSYDGFLSFTPNNWSDWLDGWNNTEWRCVSAMLTYLLYTNADNEHYQYDFTERATLLISENYTPYEYAEKFENGWIGVCKGEWDNSNGTIYTAWLLDADGNIVDTMSIEDYYDDDFNYSAYAAWEYGDMKWDLTKDRIENRWKAVQCDVPNIPETVAA